MSAFSGSGCAGCGSAAVTDLSGLIVFRKDSGVGDGAGYLCPCLRLPESALYLLGALFSGLGLRGLAFAITLSYLF